MKIICFVNTENQLFNYRHFWNLLQKKQLSLWLITTLLWHPIFVTNLFISSIPIIKNWRLTTHLTRYIYCSVVLQAHTIGRGIAWVLGSCGIRLNRLVLFTFKHCCSLTYDHSILWHWKVFSFCVIFTLQWILLMFP